MLTRPDPVALTPGAVRDLLTDGAVVLDIRSAAEYGEGHIAGALNVSEATVRTHVPAVELALEEAPRAEFY